MSGNLDKTITVSVDNYKLTLYASFVLFSMSTIFFAFSIIKTIIRKLKTLFAKKKEKSITDSINELIEMLFSKGRTSKIQIDNSFTPIKYAILCFFNKNINSFLQSSNFKKYPILMVCIHRQNIRMYTESGEYKKAIDEIGNILNLYPKYARLLMDEILKLRIFSIKSNLVFKFEPEKYKYELPSWFIYKYKSLSFFEMYSHEEKQSKRFSYITKAFETDKTNAQIVNSLVEELKKQKVSDKKIIEVLKQSFSAHPNRNLAYVVTKLKRNDLFEISQEIASCVDAENIEKQWFLCIIAMKSNLIQRMFEIFFELVKIANSDDIAKFFIANHAIMSQNSECIHIVKKRIGAEHDFIAG